MLTNITYIPQLFSFSEDNYQLSINSFTKSDNNKTINLGYIVNSENSYTISVVSLNFNPLYDIYLEDVLLNQFINLKIQSSYIFHSTSGQFDSRFKIHFYPIGLNVSLVDNKKDYLNIQYNNNALQIFTNLDIENKYFYKIYDIHGSLITSDKINSKQILIKQPKGVYLFNIYNNYNTYNMKFIVQ